MADRTETTKPRPQSDSDWVICPWCEYRHGDGWDWAKERTETRCDSCDNMFTVEPDYSVTYNTFVTGSEKAVSNAPTTPTADLRPWHYLRSVFWLAMAAFALKGATLPDTGLLGLVPHPIATVLDAIGMVAGVWIVVREMPKWRLSRHYVASATGEAATYIPHTPRPPGPERREGGEV